MTPSLALSPFLLQGGLSLMSLRKYEPHIRSSHPIIAGLKWGLHQGCQTINWSNQYRFGCARGTAPVSACCELWALGRQTSFPELPPSYSCLNSAFTLQSWLATATPFFHIGRREFGPSCPCGSRCVQGSVAREPGWKGSSEGWRHLRMPRAAC